MVTGVTSGLGIELLYGLDERKDANFFVLARHPHKFNDMIKARPLKNIAHMIACDISSLRSITLAVDKISQLTSQVDLLVNNAGIWSGENPEFSADGVEMTFAVNQLAPYFLTGSLLPLLLNSQQSRIVNTASFRHSDAIIDRDDAELKTNFNAELAYCNSKFFSILFTRLLAARLSTSTISVNCFDPGIVDTPMLKQGFPKKLRFLYPLARRLIARTPQKGAETGIFLSSMSDISGEYFKDKTIKGVSEMARDELLSEWLWSECEKMSGFTYPEIN